LKVGELHADAFEAQAGDSFVRMLGQHFQVTRLLPEIDCASIWFVRLLDISQRYYSERTL